MSAAADVTVHDTALHDGTTIPQLGFGVWRVKDDAADAAVTAALDTGYRSVDTAAIYKNEEGVGRALASAADRGIARDDIYLTTKLWPADYGLDETRAAFDVSMGKLGVETLDLYLLHWPAPASDKYLDAWKALGQLKSEGRIRSIGVSNFTPRLLTRLIDETGVVPVLNQIEVHPYLQQRQTQEFHAEHQIVTEAWSPLGAGEGLLDDEVLADIASRNGISPAQAVLAWHLAAGRVVIPKSVTPHRIAENLQAAAVTLPAADLALIDGLDRDGRTGPNPEEFNPA